MVPVQLRETSKHTVHPSQVKSKHLMAALVSGSGPFWSNVNTFTNISYIAITLWCNMQSRVSVWINSISTTAPCLNRVWAQVYKPINQTTGYECDYLNTKCCKCVCAWLVVYIALLIHEAGPQQPNDSSMWIISINIKSKISSSSGAWLALGSHVQNDP